MNEVECSGFEKSLTECYFNPNSLGCSHEEDAAVKCNVPAMGFHNRVSKLCLPYRTKNCVCVTVQEMPKCIYPFPQLRLSGGRNPYEGRVEVLGERNGSLVWGTVCSDSWGTMEAMVVCRQLGLGFASNAFQVRSSFKPSYIQSFLKWAYLCSTDFQHAQSQWIPLTLTLISLSFIDPWGQKKDITSLQTSNAHSEHRRAGKRWEGAWFILFEV